MTKIIIRENYFVSMRGCCLSLILVLSPFLLSACGGSDEENTAKTTSSVPTKGVTTEAKKSITLDTSPISIGAILKPGPIEYTKISECPFLTDKVAFSTTTKGGDFGELLDKQKPLVRMIVSNKECKWSNMNVFFQPIKTANTLQKRAVKHAKTIKLRKGPGTDAAILYRESSKKKMIPYSMGFTQGEHYILISTDTYSFVSSEKQLQAAADEIASLLPKAPKIEYQQRTEVIPIDLCKIWEKESLGSYYNIGQKGHINPTASKASCSFDLYLSNKNQISKDKIRLTVHVNNKGSVKSCQNMINKLSFSKLNDYGNKMVIYKRKEAESHVSEDYIYCFDQGSLNVRTGINLSGYSDKEKKRALTQYKTQLKPLFENLLKRIVVK